MARDKSPSTRWDDDDERESLRLLRALVDTMSAFREAHLHTGISVKNLEKYHREMSGAIKMLMDTLREERHDTEEKMSTLIASNEALRELVREQIRDTQKDFRNTIWKLFILITGILTAIGLYRVAV